MMFRHQALRAYRALVRQDGKEGVVTVRAASYEQARRMLANGNVQFVRWA